MLPPLWETKTREGLICKGNCHKSPRPPYKRALYFTISRLVSSVPVGVSMLKDPPSRAFHKRALPILKKDEALLKAGYTDTSSIAGHKKEQNIIRRPALKRANQILTLQSAAWSVAYPLVFLC